MPLTPFHYVLAYAIRKAGRRLGRDIDMAGLAMGSFAPDLECLVFIILDRLGVLYMPYHRLVLHSILGCLTLGSLAAILMALAAYRLFAPEGLERPGLRRLYTASALGNLSHVLIDAVHHYYNPLFFPFTSSNVLALVPFTHTELGRSLASGFERWAGLQPGTGPFFLATLLVYAVVLPSAAYIIVREWRRGGNLLVRLLFDV